MKTKRRYIILGLLVFGLVSLFILCATKKFDSYVKEEERKQSVVQVDKNFATEYLFFYRDDCPSCKKIFKHMVVERDIYRKPIKFINTNQIKNRKYIGEFEINYVPTIVKIRYGKKMNSYTGTNLYEINSLLDKRRILLATRSK